MASHHHIWLHPTTATTGPASCFCHCHYATYTPCYHHYPPPPPPDSYLHHPPHHPHLYSAVSHPPNLHQYHDHFQEDYFQEGRQTHPAVSSLLRRIAALESALRRRSSRSSSTQSLRDAAARTIQTHFRAFLLRRSRTLRQLKHLASVKSTFDILKSSVSEKGHLDYDVIYQKTTNLLLKLDTIQGGDPMIRNGKSSIGRELNKFLNFIEGLWGERRGLSRRANVRFGGSNVKSGVSNGEIKTGDVKFRDLKGVNVQKLRGLVERIDKLAEDLDEEQDEAIENPDEFMSRKRGVCGSRSDGLLKQHDGFQPKVKKNVRFAENEKVYRVLRRHSEPSLEDYCDNSVDRDNLVDAERELEDDLCREIEEIGVSSKEAEDEEEEEAHSDKEVYLLRSDGEKHSRCYEGERHNQDDTDYFLFRAPLPVKMAPRRESLTKGRK